MYCTQCGAERPVGATACPACGARVRTFSPPAPVPNYLVQSVLVTLCCCLPAGIVALVYAAQVNAKLAAGDVTGARAASKNAKMWSWVAFGGGLAVGIAYAIFIAVTMANAK